MTTNKRPADKLEDPVAGTPIPNRVVKMSPTDIIAQLQGNWLVTPIKLRDVIGHGFDRATVYGLLAHGYPNADVVTIAHIGAILGYRLHWVPINTHAHAEIVRKYDHALAKRKQRMQKLKMKRERAKAREEKAAQGQAEDKDNKSKKGRGTKR